MGRRRKVQGVCIMKHGAINRKRFWPGGAVCHCWNYGPFNPQKRTGHGEKKLDRGGEVVKRPHGTFTHKKDKIKRADRPLIPDAYWGIYRETLSNKRSGGVDGAGSTSARHAIHYIRSNQTGNRKM